MTTTAMPNAMGTRRLPSFPISSMTVSAASLVTLMMPILASAVTSIIPPTASVDLLTVEIAPMSTAAANAQPPPVATVAISAASAVPKVATAASPTNVVPAPEVCLGRRLGLPSSSDRVSRGLA